MFAICLFYCRFAVSFPILAMHSYRIGLEYAFFVATANSFRSNRMPYFGTTAYHFRVNRMPLSYQLHATQGGLNLWRLNIFL